MLASLGSVHCLGELSGLNLCISVLELLQWKADVQDEAELLAPLSKVLQQLLASLHPPAATLTASSPDSMAMSDDDESSSDEDNDSELQPQPRCVPCLHYRHCVCP